MKKGIIALALITVFSLAAGSAMAQPGYGCPWGGYGAQGGMYGATPQQTESYQKYMAETQQLRSQLMRDEAQLNALLMQEKPDPKQVKELNQRIAETQTQLQLKARDYGIQGQCPWCGGPMMGPGMGRGMNRGW
ncbi:Heavy-metal resistance [Desulfocurvibacter africanus PCS]|uniref:Heavy-metal resistance n=1 Tax=Desulfocurvibacter africanus PCS TaxID=1262666 RepID=M5PWC2_DESAF|nr:periplasmic heavy metal sensor [Desulfocurvibacter africanus]EMG38607.1 Heavy-metal resistance [Desulfocurvibacter africanus PCS]